MPDGSHYIWSFVGALVGSGITAIATPLVVNVTVDKLLSKLISGSATGSSLVSNMYLYDNLSVTSLAEVIRKAETAHPLFKPVINQKVSSLLDDIHFSPAKLCTERLNDPVSVSTNTIIAAKAGRQMKLGTPIIIGPPSTELQLSTAVRQVMSRSANLSKTALLSGSQIFIASELKTTDQFILSFDPFNSDVYDEELLSLAAMIELKPGCNMHHTQRPNKHILNSKLLHLPHAREFRFLKQKHRMGREIKKLRRICGDTPVALRLIGSNNLEVNLEIAVDAGINVIIIQGSETGSMLAPAITLAHTGLPLAYGLTRTLNFLKQNHLADSIDVIASGGIWESSQAVKYIAMGAKAVIMDEVTLFAMLHQQLTKTIPWHPVESILLQGGKKEHKLNVEKATASLSNFLEASRQEIALAAAVMGRSKIADLRIDDLLTINTGLNQMAGVPMFFGGDPNDIAF